MPSNDYHKHRKHTFQIIYLVFSTLATLQAYRQTTFATNKQLAIFIVSSAFGVFVSANVTFFIYWGLKRATGSW